MIKKLVSHLGEYKRAAVLTPLFAALEAVMDVLLPTIMAFIIDQGIEKGDMNAILKYGLLTFLVAVVALALGVLAGKYAAEASTGFAGNLRDAMYENIQHPHDHRCDQRAERLPDDRAHVRARPGASGVRPVHGRDDRRPAVADLRGGCGLSGGGAGRHHGAHLPHL